jgi:hypothetical protein
MKSYIQLLSLLALQLGSYSCQKDKDTTTSTATVPAVFNKFSATVTVSSDGNYITLKSNGVPDHKSCYFPAGDSRFEAYNGTNPSFQKNPNSIGTKNFVFRIPANPTLNPAHAATPLGPIGIAVNGVAIYNQFAGPNQPLTNEINSFDQYNGHPDPTATYHYHVEPLHITIQKTKSALIGFLLDGFPIYGPLENGKTLVSADLDSYHGHTTPTADYPNGTYHYHITADAPYINGAGFYGTKGIVTQ